MSNIKRYREDYSASELLTLADMGIMIKSKYDKPPKIKKVKKANTKKKANRKAIQKSKRRNRK